MFERRFQLMLSLCALMIVAFTFVGGCSSDGSKSPLDPATPDQAPPLTPTGVGLAGMASTKFFLSWTPNVDPDLAGYRVYLYDPNPERNSAFTCLTGASLWQTNAFTCSGTIGATYTFRVTAVDANGNESAMSAPLTFLFTATGNTQPGAGWSSDNGRSVPGDTGNHTLPPYRNGDGGSEK